MLARTMRSAGGVAFMFVAVVVAAAGCVAGGCARGDESGASTAQDVGDDAASTDTVDGATHDGTSASALDAAGDVADATSTSETGAPPGDDAGDAGSDSAIDAPDASLDAGCDASPATIPPTGTDTFQSPVNPHWAKAGSADINGAMQGWSQLTADSSSQAGALWWNANYTFDHFDVTFTFEIQAKSGGADGLAFAWVPGTDVTKAGNSGGSYGFVGLGGGWAVAIDTYQNSGEPAAPFLAVVDSTGAHLQRATIPNVRDGNGHTMRVLLQAGHVTVWVDSTSYIGALALTNYTPFTGHWGFTAGTGTSTERHSVTGISMIFPDGQGCVP
jgi:hypothetical protein